MTRACATRLRLAAVVPLLTVVLPGLLSPGASAQTAGPAVFVLNNVSDEITSYTMNGDGTLNFIGLYPTSDGPQTADISPDGMYLAVGHGTISNTTESFQVHRVHPDASISLMLDIQVPDSPTAAIWLTDELLAIIENPSPSGSSVSTYRWDPNVPSLMLIDTETTGSFTMHLVRHPSLDLFYAQDSTSNTVSWFTFDGDGYLTPAGSVGTGVYPLGPGISPDGRYMYAGGGISGGGDKIVGLRADVTGALTVLPGSPFTSPGASPKLVRVSSDVAWAFVGHGTDATLRSFAIDYETGALTSTGYFFDVGLQGTLGDAQVLGDYVLVTDESTAIDGIKGTYSFEIQPDGNFIAVAPIYDPGGTRPETIVTWDPASSLEGDVNGDGVVDVLDLLAVLGAWGPCPGCPEDVNGDGTVDVLDLLLVLANWT